MSARPDVAVPGSIATMAVANASHGAMLEFVVSSRPTRRRRGSLVTTLEHSGSLWTSQCSHTVDELGLFVDNPPRGAQ